jgi:hypothetical protein
MHRSIVLGLLLLIVDWGQLLAEELRTLYVSHEKKRVIGATIDTNVARDLRSSWDTELRSLILDPKEYERTLQDPMFFLKRVVRDELTGCTVTRLSKEDALKEVEAKSKFFEGPDLLTVYDRVDFHNDHFLVRWSELSFGFRLLSKTAKPSTPLYFSLKPDVFRHVNGPSRVKMTFWQGNKKFFAVSTGYDFSSITMIDGKTLEIESTFFFGGALYESIIRKDLQEWIRIDL